MGKGQILYNKAKARIPGGTQLLSKRPEMFLPDHWPSYYARAEGVTVWDLDGNRYTDMSYNGIGACVLGAADPDVDRAVFDAIRAGNMSTLNCPEELWLAELLCSLHPWAEMVRYARCGGEAMAVAVRIARAHTGKDRVAFCGYHGWHDWYLAANLAQESALDGHLLPGLSPAGVPRGLLKTALPFHYNRLDELEQIGASVKGDLAAIVMEPIRGDRPTSEFLDGIRRLQEKTGAVLIVDEVSSGFRLNAGGAHLLFSLEPDIAVFAKAISNGYPMAAIIGKAGVMQAAQKTFMSSTYWTDRIGPAAAIATIQKIERHRVYDHLVRAGSRVQDGWQAAADATGLDIRVGGIPPLSHFSFSGQEAPILHTLFTQLMLKKGFLATKGFYATFAHQDAHLDGYLAAVREVFRQIEGLDTPDRRLEALDGPVAHTGFHRLT